MTTTPTASTTCAAELRGVTKCYGAFKANDCVDLHILEGTIHGLIGENGAGKSTAMKMLYGMTAHDGGDLIVRGVTRTQWTPRAAFQAGIGMVHQHFMLAGTESVLDNLVLGIEAPGILGFRNRAADRRKVEALMEDTGLKVPLSKCVNELSVGEQSRIEILKVLLRNASLLILDEPTAVLTPQEVEGLLGTLRKLRTQGKTVLLVTHKLHEIMAVADDVTVFRAGKSVGRVAVKDTSVPNLTEMMIGRHLQLPKRNASASATAASHDPKRVVLQAPGFDLAVKPGEILGIAGIEGNGQDQLVAELMGDSVETRKKPVAVIPPDRHRDAVVLGMTLDENLKLGREQACHKGHEFFRESGNDKALESFLKVHDVRPANPHAKLGALSGGNQQKLVVARELDFTKPAPDALIVAHPTRGVDLGAIEHIHRKILAAADSGAGVALVSSELEELMNLSDRIGVMYRGKIVSWFSPPFDEKKIGLAMLTGAST